MFHQRQVVGDEYQGQAEFLLQVLEQIDDLGLDRYIQRADRFITNHQLGVEHQRPRDANPLALAAGELVWVAIDLVRQQTHHFHHAPGSLFHLQRGHIGIKSPQRLRDDIPGSHARIQ